MPVHLMVFTLQLIWRDDMEVLRIFIVELLKGKKNKVEIENFKYEIN